MNSVIAQLDNSPWPVFRGNLKNTGLSPYDTSHVDGTIKWRYAPYQEGFWIESSVSIDRQGNLYFSTHNNDVISLNPDGTLRWKFDAGEQREVKSPQGTILKGSHATPAVSEDGVIYVSTLSNYLFALDSSNGKEKWRYPLYLDSDSWSSPVIGKDGTIYSGSSNVDEEGTGAKIYAINPDGTTKWAFNTESDVFPTIAIGDDGTIYSGNGAAGKFYAINPDGSLKWFYQTGKHIESSTAIGTDGTLYFGSWDTKIYALSPEGEKKWEYKTGKGIVASPGIAKDGTIYMNTNDGYVYALTPSGSLKWKYYIGDYYETSPSPTIGADGTIYVGSPYKENTNSFLALNPDGTLKWSALHSRNCGISSSATIGSDGTVYVATHQEVIAFGGPDEGLKEEESEQKEPKETDQSPPEQCIINGKFIGEEQCRALVDKTSPKGNIDEGPPEECMKNGEFIGRDKCEALMKGTPLSQEETPTKQEETTTKKGFFQKVIDWFRSIFN